MRPVQVSDRVCGAISTGGFLIGMGVKVVIESEKDVWGGGGDGNERGCSGDAGRRRRKLGAKGRFRESLDRLR